MVSKNKIKTLGSNNHDFPQKLLSGRLALYNTPTAPLQRGKTPLTSVLDMTPDNLMVRSQ